MAIYHPVAQVVTRTQRGARIAPPHLDCVRGSASVPIGTYGDALKPGWNGHGSVIFNFARLPFALRADFSYNKFTFKNNLPFSTGGSNGTITTTDDIAQQILGGLANITIPFHMGPMSVRHRQTRALQHRDAAP